MGAVAVEIDGVDDAAALEGEPCLPREEGMRLRPADAQRMRVARQQSGIEQAVHVGRLHRAVADAALGGLDLDQRLQPHHAARAVAADGDVLPARGRHLGDPPGDAVGTDGLGAGIGGNPDRDAHVRTSRTISAATSSSMRPITSPSSMAAGAQAHRPRQ